MLSATEGKMVCSDRLLTKRFVLPRRLQYIAPSFRSLTSLFTLPNVSRPLRANHLKTASPEAAISRPLCVSEGTGANSFAGYARTQSISLVMGGSMKETAMTLMWKAAVRSRKMTMKRGMVWSPPLSLGTPPSLSQKNTHLRGWIRCQGSSTDSFGSFVAALRTLVKKAVLSHRHLVSCRLLWKIGTGKSCVAVDARYDGTTDTRVKYRRRLRLLNGQERSQVWCPTRVHPPLSY